VKRSRLDPRRANVGFSWEDLGGGCVGRVYYWYDPDGNRPALNDHEFRGQHAELNDEQWPRLFYEAFDRAETEFVEKWPADPESV
jgi:hypothetical protein